MDRPLREQEGILPILGFQRREPARAAPHPRPPPAERYRRGTGKKLEKGRAPTPPNALRKMSARAKGAQRMCVLVTFAAGGTREEENRASGSSRGSGW